MKSFIKLMLELFAVLIVFMIAVKLLKFLILKLMEYGYN